MGGWELIIALFGGAWYVISAISAANEKKKKKAQRKLALQAEEADSKKPSAVGDMKPAAPVMEVSREPEVLIGEARSLRKTRPAPDPTASIKPSATVNLQTKEPGVIREARKAILDSMRKELGLTVQAAAAPVESKPLKVPETPPPPAPRPEVRMPRRSTPAPRRPMPGAQTASPSNGPKSGSSTDLSTLLRRKSGLKQAIILSEIFQPPVSLRGQHLS